LTSNLVVFSSNVRNAICKALEIIG
jgi:hypothetical protein